jgi:hypothetical protein
VPRAIISAAMPATAIEPRMWTSMAPVREVRAGTSWRSGTEEVAIVRIVPPRERTVVRTAALAGLAIALGVLLFLLAL